MSVTANLTTNVETITATIQVEEETIVAEINTAARGPAGPAGEGGNIDADTTSDGTADLDLLNVTTATATVTGTLTADHIHGNIAGSVYAHVTAGEALLKGDPVYVSGFNNGTSTAQVMKADAANASKMPAVGIMDADVAHNASGHMVITGTITGLNTNAYTVNAELYVNSGGGLTATPPSARAQPVARVERVNTNNGAIIVKVNGLSASDGTANTLVRRDASGNFSASAITATSLTSNGFTTDGQVEFNGTDAGDSLAFNMVNYTYGEGAASAHRIALGGVDDSSTGTALFGAATVAAARTTLGVRTFKTTSDVSNSTQTPSNGNVPELTFPVVAGKTYKIDFCFILAAAGGSFVHQIKATYPTATLPTLGDCLGLHRFTVKAPTPGSTSMDFNTSTAAAATSGAHSGYWFYRPSASGNVTFQIYNYDATAVTNTLKAGTTVTVTEL
jgi:hypothetical protein